MTFRQYSRHRGVSPEAVSKAVRDGRITTVLDKAGKRWIDPAKADAQWAQNSDAAKQVGGEARRRGGSGPALDGPQTFEPGGGQRGPSYHESRAIREAYLARLAKLDYEERTGKLVPLDKVKVDLFRAVRQTRDMILSIPDRVSPELAGMTDPAVIRTRLADELTRALEALANAV